MRLHMPSFLVGIAAVLAAMMAVHLFARVRADTYLTIPFASYHMPQSSNPSKRYNENNIGFGLEHEVTDSLSIVGGTFRNSLYRTSFYAGAAYMPVEIQNVKLGLSGGLVTGYLAKPAPMVVPTVTLRPHSDVGLNIMAVPPFPASGTPGVIAFALRWRF